ncbi:hypothetical protein DOY81_002015 [Sarcophaga bullata]|nr:hypothetical protein DOY81_002015 [Sarcophaga bullata]
MNLLKLNKYIKKKPDFGSEINENKPTQCKIAYSVILYNEILQKSK